MTEGKRNIIHQLLEEYDIQSAEDIQDALKDLLGGTIKEMMEAEMDDHLGYEKSERSDNDDYRRGKLTTHKKFGEDFGILAGDGLLNLAYETMLSAIHKAAKTGDAQAVLRYSAAADVIANKAGVDGMVGGQSLDVMLTDKPMNEEQLDYIFRLKTGALIEAAFMAGGIIAGCDENVTKLLEKTGYNIGFAFQIKDDILDVTSTQEVLGKPVLSDERNNKTTYVTLYGMEKAEKDTADMSVKALETLKTIGHNEYLEDLITMLIHRDR